MSALVTSVAGSGGVCAKVAKASSIARTRSVGFNMECLLYLRLESSADSLSPRGARQRVGMTGRNDSFCRFQPVSWRTSLDWDRTKLSAAPGQRNDLVADSTVQGAGDGLQRGGQDVAVHADTHHGVALTGAQFHEADCGRVGAAADRVLVIIQDADGQVELLVQRVHEGVDGAVAFPEDGVLCGSVAPGGAQLTPFTS